MVEDPEHAAVIRDVYDHSADLFATEVGTEVSARFEAPLDRAVLAAYAEMIAGAEPGLVLDIGCGTGPVAASPGRGGIGINRRGGATTRDHPSRTARCARPTRSCPAGGPGRAQGQPSAPPRLRHRRRPGG